MPKVRLASKKKKSPLWRRGLDVRETLFLLLMERGALRHAHWEKG